MHDVWRGGPLRALQRVPTYVYVFKFFFYYKFYFNMSRLTSTLNRSIRRHNDASKGGVKGIAYI